MIDTQFQVRNANGRISPNYTSLRDAVLDAARHDGWGAAFQRDAEGVMRLFSSQSHIGNNPYRPAKQDAFRAESRLQNDREAESDVAEQVFKSGLFHSKYTDMEIIKLTFHGEELTHVDGRPLADLAAEFDDNEISVETVRSWYGKR